MKKSLDESFFFCFTNRKGLAKKKFDRVFNYEDKDLNQVRSLFKKDWSFSISSLNKASIFFYDKDLNNKQIATHFVITSFLFELEKFSKNCISIEELTVYLNISKKNLEEMYETFWKNDKEIPIIYDLDSFYFRRYYESEKNLANLMLPFLDSNPTKNLDLILKVRLNKVSFIKVNTIDQTYDWIEHNLLNTEEFKKLTILCVTEDSYVRLNLLFKDRSEVEILLYYSFKSQFFFKDQNLEHKHNLPDDSKILIYESNLLNLFDLEFLLRIKVNRLIFLGYWYEEFYFSNSTFFQLCKLDYLSGENIFFSEQSTSITNIVKSSLDGAIDFEVSKPDMNFFKEGFYFIEDTTLDSLEDFLLEYSVKFEDSKSVIVSPFRSNSLNEMIHVAKSVNKDLEIQDGQPIIFSQNFINDSDYIFKGLFLKYDLNHHSSYHEKYGDSFQSAYVISHLLALNTEWDNICFEYTVDFMEDFEIFSLLFSLLSKTKKSFIFISNKKVLKNLNSSSKLGKSNLMQRIEKYGK